MIGEDAPVLTLEDVKGFLASCEDTDDVGIPSHIHGCLAAETAKWKYSLRYVPIVPADNTRFSLWQSGEGGEQKEGFIDPDVTPYLDRFDHIFFDEWYDSEAEEQTVTKADLRRIPVFVDLLAEEVQV